MQCLESMCPTTHYLVVPTWPCCLRHYTWLRTTHNAQCTDPFNLCSLSICHPWQSHGILSRHFFPSNTTTDHQWGQILVGSRASVMLDTLWGQQFKNKYLHLHAKCCLVCRRFTYLPSCFPNGQLKHQQNCRILMELPHSSYCQTDPKYQKHLFRAAAASKVWWMVSFRGSALIRPVNTFKWSTYV